MKKFAVVLVMLMVSISSFSQFVSAPKGQTYKKHVGQTVSSSQSAYAPNKFKTYEEAIAAYHRGNFSYYTPSDLRSYGKNSVNGTSKVLISLEQDAIIQSPVVGGVFYVIMPTGSKFRWYRDANGCVADKPYAIDACGNAVLFFEYILREKEVVKEEIPVNNYSNKSYTQPYKNPNDYNYGCNSYKPLNSYQPTGPEKKGWSTEKKVLVIVAAIVVAAATYAIIANSKSRNGSESSEQVVVTGGASFVPQTLPANLSSAPRAPSVGLAFGIRF